MSLAVLPRVFISYKRKHDASDAFIQILEKELSRDFDILRDVNLPVAGRWSHDLYDWLLTCDAAIVIVSEEANKSDWCRREWAVLAARQTTSLLPIIPVFVEGKSVTTKILDHLQALKLHDSNRDSVLSSVRDVLARNLPKFIDFKNFEKLTAKNYLAAHQAWLRWQYNDAPVFQREPYSLNDVYVEPECGKLLWDKIDSDKIDPFSDKDECGGRESLLETTLSLIADPQFKDLITLQAGPGAGKSAFTLHLANTLQNEGLQPLLVRFRDLRLASFANVGELLDDALRIGYADEDSPNLPKDAFLLDSLLDERISFRGADICKTVIVLDGWDEVSLTGNESFKAQLSTWLPKLREYLTDRRGVRVRMILTGRPSAEVSHSGVLRKTTPVLTMRTMRPEQLSGFAQSIAGYLQQAQTDESAGWYLDAEILQPVFEHYQSWFEADNKSESSTGDFLGNPLLAYLSFRVFSETDKSPDTLINEPTALYHELINITAQHAGKGKCEGLEDSVHRGGDGLRRLLQEVAVTISMFRRESVSFAELNERFDDPELPLPAALLKDWSKQADTGSALQELVINFYFKGGNTNLGCEFLHKSFREYLFAEAIYYALLDVAEGQSGLFECKAYKYWEDVEASTPEYELSRRLSYLLAPQWMTEEVRGHLFWLMDQGITKDPEKWTWLRDVVLSVYAWWAEGVMLRHQSTRSRVGGNWKPPFVDELFQQVIPFDAGGEIAPMRTNVLDAHLGHSLMQITAFIFDRLFERVVSKTNVQGRAVNYFALQDDYGVRFSPGGKGFLRTLIARVDTEGWRGERSAFADMFLCRISAVGEDLRFLMFHGCNISRSDMTGVNFNGANMNHVNLKGVYLSGSHFWGTWMAGYMLNDMIDNDSDLSRFENIYDIYAINSKLSKRDKK